MKILFLSILAISSLGSVVFPNKNNTNFSELNKNDSKIQYLENEIKKREPEFDGVQNSIFNEKETNNSFETSNIIYEDVQKIQGTIGNPADVDIFRLTVRKTIEYHFSLTAPDYIEYDLYEYGNTPRLLHHTYNNSDVTLTFVPGTYYFKIYANPNDYTSSNVNYSFYCHRYEVHYSNLGLTDEVMGRYDMAIWENDLRPKNVERNPEELEQTVLMMHDRNEYRLYGLTGVLFGRGWDENIYSHINGYIDPYFIDEIPEQEQSETYIDSILYVWDEKVKEGIYGMLTDLMEDAHKKYHKDLFTMKVHDLGIRFVADDWQGTLKLWLEGTEDTGDFVSLFSDYVDDTMTFYNAVKKIIMYLIPDAYLNGVEDETVNGDFLLMLGKLHQAVEDSIEDGFVLKIPKYAKIYRTVEKYCPDKVTRAFDVTTEYRWYWTSTCFEYNIDRYHFRETSGTVKSSVYYDETCRTFLGNIRLVPTARPVLESIEVSGDYNTNYTVGDTFTTNGLEVTAYYDDGSSKRLNLDDVVIDDSNVKTDVAGSYKVYLEYVERGIRKTYEYDVFVSNPNLVFITLEGNPQTTFRVDDAFNHDGLIVYAHYDNGDVVQVDDYQTSEPNMSTKGTETITVSFTDNGITKTSSYTITVLNKIGALKSITLSGDYRTTFYTDETFNHDGLIVTAHYEEAEDQIVTDYIISGPTFDRFLGKYFVGIQYTENGVTAKTYYTINRVARPILTSISLSGEYQTTFYANDKFNYDGLVVTAHYENHDDQIVENFTVSRPKFNKEMNSYIVTVSYTEGDITVTDSYIVNMMDEFRPDFEYDLESISLSGTYKMQFRIGDVFNYDGLIVIAHYFGKTPDKEVKNFTVLTNANMMKAGIYNVDVLYTEGSVTKIASYTIFVGRKPPIVIGDKEPTFPIGKGNF